MDVKGDTSVTRGRRFVVGVVVVVVVVVVLLVETTSAQLDLPTMPGPPYPDPRGQNRWGVKFDPRKHGPPFDKRGSANRNVWYRGPSGKGRVKDRRDRDRDRDFDRERRPSREQQRDSFWSPGKMRRHSRPNKKHRRQNRFNGNDAPRRGPRNQYKSSDDGWKWPSEQHEKMKFHPKKEEEEKFWKSWNAWYKKQVDVKEQLKKGKGIHHTFPYGEAIVHGKPSGPIYYIDAEEFEKVKLEGEDTDDDESESDHHASQYGNSIFGKHSARLRDFYWNRMQDVVRKAKSLASFGDEESEDEKFSSDEHRGRTQPEIEDSPEEGWRIFTTIGKGIDAANVAMGSVRTQVGKSILGTGIKYGGKMAMDVASNVATSALSTAIKTAAFG